MARAENAPRVCSLPGLSQRSAGSRSCKRRAPSSSLAAFHKSKGTGQHPARRRRVPTLWGSSDHLARIIHTGARQRTYKRHRRHRRLHRRAASNPVCERPQTSHPNPEESEPLQNHQSLIRSEFLPELLHSQEKPSVDSRDSRWPLWHR